ncbi:hypothetical protein JOD97_001928 [Duganella sp. 1411]|uniref:hypothetical protein n=1 Tax=Duganella sp. 1411 TaxID=2806572 RepID=UPI001AE1AC9F|nr:hypothetical protein [Duganella sp. 1411]MBP1203914.1 hypothetical protein [Duganella sp. 1411]
MPDWPVLFDYLSEAIKIIGGLASLYAVIKLRQIERRYLFRATMPNLILELQQSLESLDELLSEREFDQSAAFPILSNLLADVRSVKRKASGDSLAIAKHLIGLIEMAQSTTVSPRGVQLDEIYGRGIGLVRSLRHDQVDQDWSRK